MPDRDAAITEEESRQKRRLLLRRISGLAAAEDAGIEYARTKLLLGPPRVTQVTLLAAMFTSVAKWVRRGGWIEIGQQQKFGFVVRALDCGGLVFEDTEARTLDEAMAALERGIAEHIDDEIDTARLT